MADYGLNKNKALSLLMVLAGNLLYALSVKLFLLPANLISCGTTGIALVVNHLTGVPMSWFIFAINMVMLLLGWWILGKQFAMTTVLSSLFYPIALEVLNMTLGDLRITEDLFLNTLFAGLGLSGAGILLHYFQVGGAKWGCWGWGAVQCPPGEKALHTVQLAARGRGLLLCTALLYNLGRSLSVTDDRD